MGKVNELSAEEEHLLGRRSLAHGAPYHIPALASVDVGHTAPRLTLPIGGQTSLDSEHDLFSLDEAAVV